MPFLVSKQTADWIRRAMGRGETFGSRPRPAPHLARERPMPFDCQIRRVDNNGDTETHLFCYVPNRNGLVRVAGGSVTATFCGDTAKIDNDWLDLGEAEKGDSATLYLLAPSSASTLAEKLAAACWDVKIGSAPTGSYTVIGPPAPSVLLAEWTQNDGLRQRFHGPYLAGGGRLGGLDVELDTDRSPGNPPGESVNRYRASASSDGGPVQLRQFHDMTDTLAVQDASSTGSDPTAADVQVLVRHANLTGGRPRLEYVEGDGIFWVQGGDGSTNYGTEIKLGSASAGFITISAS